MLKEQNLRTDTCSPLHEAAAQVNNPPFEPGICCRKEIANAKAKVNMPTFDRPDRKRREKHVVGIEMRQNFLATNTHTHTHTLLGSGSFAPLFHSRATTPHPVLVTLVLFFLCLFPPCVTTLGSEGLTKKKKRRQEHASCGEGAGGLATAQATPLPSASPSAPYGHTSHVDA